MVWNSSSSTLITLPKFIYRFPFSLGRRGWFLSAFSQPDYALAQYTATCPSTAAVKCCRLQKIENLMEFCEIPMSHFQIYFSKQYATCNLAKASRQKIVILSQIFLIFNLNFKHLFVRLTMPNIVFLAQNASR